MTNRIQQIPRRNWRERAAEARQLNALLRAPGGTQELHDIQAVSLLEAWETGTGVCCYARVGAGKAQPVDEPVLTPAGWRPIGSLTPGDEVIGSNGHPTTVLSVHPQGVRDVARVEMSDGSWTRCDWDHLWTARDGHGVTRTRTLREWKAYGFDRKCGEHRAHKIFVPLTVGVFRPHADLPLDPYTLGALLGDGCLTQVTPGFTSMDFDIVSRLVLPGCVKARATVSTSSGAATQYTLSQGRELGKRGNPNPLMAVLRLLDLAGRNSADKFIPPLYLSGSLHQRSELLRGLLDTDGTIAAPGGWIEYSTLSEALALGVQQLVWSLGGTARINADAGNGNARLGLKLPNDIIPFHCARKLARWRGNGQRGPLRAMVSAEQDGRAECVCIKVAAVDSLYTTRDFILTHNTAVIGLLPTLMANHPLRYSRPLIVVPGSLRAKTESEFAAGRKHWRIAHQYWLESYTALAQESKADILEERQPDMLLFDEPDGLRRINATSRRIGRYIQSRREQGKPTFCGFFHATPYRDAITDFSHMVNWALGERSPFPLDPLEVQQWSAWLDEEDASGKSAFTKYFDIGGAGRGTVERSEDAFRERITSAPGIILSDDSFTGAELSVDVWVVDPGLDREFEQLRTLWQRPDGWDLTDAKAADDDPDEVNTWSIWGVARQLALGFWYQADPTPPKAWMAARKAWVGYVRQMIDAPNSRFDTEKQVRTACEKAAERGGRKVPEWSDWMAIKDTFTPGRRPVWISTHAIDAAKAWGAQGPGVIWTDMTAFGHRLSQETGWTYYGQRGLDAAGRSIEQAPGDRPVIASTRANQRGRNLQYRFWRNLNMSVQNAASDFEQWLGRTHRYGQVNSRVQADIYCACAEHWKALDVKVPKGARKSERLLGLTQKLNSVNMNIHGAPPVEAWAWR